MHYYCRKQHKNIGNSQIIEQNVVIYLCPSLCLLRLLLPSPSSTAEFFQFLDTVLREYSANFKPLPPIFQGKQPTPAHFLTKPSHSHPFFEKTDPLPPIFQEKQPTPTHFSTKTTHSYPYFDNNNLLSPIFSRKKPTPTHFSTKNNISQQKRSTPTHF